MKKLDVTRHNEIITVAINEPPVNVISSVLLAELDDFLDEIAQDEMSKVVIFQSANTQFFSAQLDLTVINGTQEGQRDCGTFNEIIMKIKALPQLTVSVVDGIARGGGNELVMACDLSFGTENAVFAQPELATNIPTGGQGAVQFTRRMGRSKALLALLTGSDFTAQEAEALSIITKFVSKTALPSFLERLKQRLTFVERRDIKMLKDICDASIESEESGADVELEYFLERAKEDKTQSIIAVGLKNGSQTEREATDMDGLIAETLIELQKIQTAMSSEAEN